jgi:hypothetical protein
MMSSDPGARAVRGFGKRETPLEGAAEYAAKIPTSRAGVGASNRAANVGCTATGSARMADAALLGEDVVSTVAGRLDTASALQFQRWKAVR